MSEVSLESLYCFIGGVTVCNQNDTALPSLHTSYYLNRILNNHFSPEALKISISLLAEQLSKVHL